MAKLLVEKGRQVKLEVVAQNLGVSTRTLRNWKSNYKKSSWPVVGRPELKASERLRVARIVAKVWHEQGRPGWRPLKAESPMLPTRLVQKYVRQLKSRERKVSWAYKRDVAQKTSVLFKDTIWTQDATLLDKGLYAEVIKDRGSLKIEAFDLTNTLAKETTLKILKSKSLPLVYMSDNGSAYCSKEVSEYLKSQRVIHLKNLPRTPQHNGAAEIAVRELKNLYRHNTSLRMSPEDAVKKAKLTLNEKRRYMSRNYRTAHEVEQEMPSINKEELRDKIYAEYEKELLKIKSKTTSKRKSRVMERKMIYALLEKYGLIKITRGSRKWIEKAEVIL